MVNSSFVPATSLGIRLTRYAPVRMWCRCTADMAEWLLRMLPVSLMLSAPRNTRPGGAKSNDVNVADFLNAWGLGSMARSSKDDASGI